VKFALVFTAGVILGWVAHTYGPPGPVTTNTQDTRDTKERTETKIIATTGRSNLRLPIDGMNVEAMKGGFTEQRPGHEHGAVDILAPRNTAVHAVDDGSIAKLFYSKGGGGNTIYQYDPGERICYYYAHLERYADGIRDGQRVSKGDVIGYVGTSGNAPPNTPHLHFAVYQLDETHRWWKGRALDPYLVFTSR
jgi:murein DD-endopeptidase MepM/ murein hydrolase activator NlpD